MKYILLCILSALALSSCCISPYMPNCGMEPVDMNYSCKDDPSCWTVVVNRSDGTKVENCECGCPWGGCGKMTLWETENTNAHISQR